MSDIKSTSLVNVYTVRYHKCLISRQPTSQMNIYHIVHFSMACCTCTSSGTWVVRQSPDTQTWPNGTSITMSTWPAVTKQQSGLQTPGPSPTHCKPRNWGGQWVWCPLQSLEQGISAEQSLEQGISAEQSPEQGISAEQTESTWRCKKNFQLLWVANIKPTVLCAGRDCALTRSSCHNEGLHTLNPVDIAGHQS